MKRSTLILMAVLALAACTPPLEPAFDPSSGTYSLETTADRLHQRIVFSNIAPKQGEVVTIHATVTNLGNTRDLTTRICGLDWEGVQTEMAGVACAGYSMKSSVAPNGFIEGGDARIIKSPPGDYTLKIRHLIDPEQWIEVKLHVQAP